MKMTSTNRLIIAMVVLAGLAAAFWMLALSPKREEAKELGAEVERLEASVAQHHAEVVEAEEARDEFPVAYRQLVVLGKAVPGDDDTASLLIQLNRIAEKAGAEFDELKLGSSEGSAPPPSPEELAAESAGATATLVSPTEAAASTLPLGATIGTAGLGVMPYNLSFAGDFFEIADFIKALDALVKTSNEKVAVQGRLITIDGFSLHADKDKGFPALNANFGVTTYLTPPDQGVTAGATSEGPELATPAATTTGGTP